jgi:hypothetical protein
VATGAPLSVTSSNRSAATSMTTSAPGRVLENSTVVAQRNTSSAPEVRSSVMS